MFVSSGTIRLHGRTVILVDGPVKPIVQHFQPGLRADSCRRRISGGTETEREMVRYAAVGSTGS